MPFVIVTAALGTAAAIPAGSLAQEQPVPGCETVATYGLDRGYVQVNCGHTGPNRAKTPFSIKVTYSVTQRTRTKNKLPSRTLATKTLKGKGRDRLSVVPSTAMRAALKKLKKGTKIMVVVKAVYTTPVAETVTDSFVMRSFGYGFNGPAFPNGAKLDTQNPPL